MLQETTAPSETTPLTDDELEVLVGLAHCVSADGGAPVDEHGPAAYLNSTNGKVGTATIEDAVYSCRPFMVLPAPWLLVVDHDKEHAAARYMRILQAVKLLGLSYVEQASGGADHKRHLLVVIGVVDAEVRARIDRGVKQLLDDVQGLRADHGGIRPPLSPHRSGGQPRLLSHTEPWDAVNALSAPYPDESVVAELADLIGADEPAPVKKPAVKRKKRSSNRTDIPAYLAGRLKHGTQHGLRRRTINSVLISMVNRNWTQDDAVEAVLDSPLAECYENRNWHREAEKQWDEAVQYVDDHPPAADAKEVRALLDVMAVAVAGHPWDLTGSSSATLDSVMAVLIETAHQAGRFTDVSMGDRRWALEAGKLGRSTLWRARKNLEVAGVITAGTDSDALKRLSAGWTINRSHDVFKSGGVQATPVSPTHDAWVHGALKGSRRTLQMLSPTVCREATELVESVGVSVGSVRRHLAKLEAHGLAVRAGNKKWLCVPADDRQDLLDAAAEALHTDGAIADRAEADAEHQAAYRKWLDRDRDEDDDEDDVDEDAEDARRATVDSDGAVASGPSWRDDGDGGGQVAA